MNIIDRLPAVFRSFSVLAIPFLLAGGLLFLLSTIHGGESILEIAVFTYIAINIALNFNKLNQISGVAAMVGGVVIFLFWMSSKSY